MPKEFDLQKISADVKRALSMPEGEAKNTLTNSVMAELSGLLDVMAKIANRMSEPVENSSHKIGTSGSGRSKAN
jgi:hypothetical protein